jgi:hypothetical protein
MKVVAIYATHSGQITSLIALPADADAPSAGARMRPGESRAEIDLPQGIALTLNDPQTHAQMQQIIREYRIEGTDKPRIVKKASGP